MPPTTKSPTPPAGPPPKPDDLVMLEQISAALDGALDDIERLDPVAPGQALAIIGVAIVKAVAPILRTELADQLRRHADRVAAYERAIAEEPAR
jgi:hypothetical protein